MTSGTADVQTRPFQLAIPVRPVNGEVIPNDVGTLFTAPKFKDHQWYTVRSWSRTITTTKA